MMPKVCEHCGREYRARRPSQRYCSLACRDNAIRALPDRKCLFCKQAFRPKKGCQDYCSKRCGRLDNVRTVRPMTQVELFNACQRCGKTILGRGAVCEACHQSELRARDHQRGYARRAVTGLAVAELIDPLDIAERDGWRCGLCGDRVEQGLKWPNPDALSLDHILPIAKGGKHTRDNVQLAHLRCNWSKGKGRARWRGDVEAMVAASN